MTEDVAQNISEAIKFLEERIETSMFLLGNLNEHGPHLGPHLNSGNFKFLKKGEEIKGVFCLTRRGNLLLQTDQNGDYSKEIFESISNEGIALEGILGNWPDCSRFYDFYKSKHQDFELTFESKEILFSLDLNQKAEDPPLPSSISVRFLENSDYSEWDVLNRDYFEEEGLTLQGDLESRKHGFKVRTEACEWWGLTKNDRLISIGAFNSKYKKVAQIGGVYTIPSERKKGYAKICMNQLIADSQTVHRLEKLILFTGEKNLAAQNLYRSLGFSEIGNFGLLFGRHMPESKDENL